MYNICIAGTIGIHFSPKNIFVKSGAKTKISPAIEKDKNAVNCKTFIYASLNLCSFYS
jgi:hypothetical protein